MKLLNNCGIKCLSVITCLMFFSQFISVLNPTDVDASAKPALYDFGMGKCLPCKEMEKILAFSLFFCYPHRHVLLASLPPGAVSSTFFSFHPRIGEKYCGFPDKK